MIQLLQISSPVNFFSAIADEAADSSHKEKMSLVLHFVDSDMNIREEFIAFLHCKYGLSGAQLAKLLLDALNDLTLSIEDCYGAPSVSLLFTLFKALNIIIY